MDFKNFQKNAVVLTKADLVEGFLKGGIVKGDILMIHSSLRGLGYIENGANDIIEALQEVVGEEGTLVFPTYSIKGSMLDTVKDPDYTFDPKTSPSAVGSITNKFMTYEGVHRSIHPTHSVSAWGKHAKNITATHFESGSNFGPSTPFGKVLELNGKIMGLGIDYGNVTYYHVYEDYNLDKWPNVYLNDDYETRVKDYDGKVHMVRIKVHNPDFHKNRIESVPEIEQFFSQHLESKQISFRTEIGQGHLWWMRSQDLINELDKLYQEGKSIYSVK